MKRIREKRIRADMTQQELAKAVGVTVRTINNWEQGRFSPHAIFLKKLKEVLS